MDGPRSPGWGPAALAVASRAASAACGVIFVALVAWILWRSAALLALLYAAAILAVLLDRPVAALGRIGLRRPIAVALVATGVSAFTLALVVVAFGPLVAQARELASAAPAVADRIRATLSNEFGSSLDGLPLGTWFHDLASRGAGSLAGFVYGAAGGVGNAAGALATLFVTAVLLLASGPRLVQRAIGALPPPRRPFAHALAHDLSISLGGYLVGLSAIVAARTIATGAFLAVARIPFVVPLAVLAGLSVLVPYVGSVLRFLAIGIVAWAVRGSGGAAAALAFIALYDVVENYAISPIVYRRTLGISALAQLFAVLFLGYHFGLAGAALAIPVVATAHIVSRALRSQGLFRWVPATRPVDEEAGGVAHPTPHEARPGERPGDSRNL